jgi:hypothetical protein
MRTSTRAASPSGRAQGFGWRPTSAVVWGLLGAVPPALAAVVNLLLFEYLEPLARTGIWLQLAVVAVILLAVALVTRARARRAGQRAGSCCVLRGAPAAGRPGDGDTSRSPGAAPPRAGRGGRCGGGRRLEPGHPVPGRLDHGARLPLAGPASRPGDPRDGIRPAHRCQFRLPVEGTRERGRRGAAVVHHGGIPQQSRLRTSHRQRADRGRVERRQRRGLNGPPSPCSAPVRVRPRSC